MNFEKSEDSEDILNSYLENVKLIVSSYLDQIGFSRTLIESELESIEAVFSTETCSAQQNQPIQIIPFSQTSHSKNEMVAYYKEVITHEIFHKIFVDKIQPVLKNIDPNLSRTIVEGSVQFLTEDCLQFYNLPRLSFRAYEREHEIMSHFLNGRIFEFLNFCINPTLDDAFFNRELLERIQAKILELSSNNQV